MRSSFPAWRSQLGSLGARAVRRSRGRDRARPARAARGTEAAPRGPVRAQPAKRSRWRRGGGAGAAGASGGPAGCHPIGATCAGSTASSTIRPAGAGVRHGRPRGRGLGRGGCRRRGLLACSDRRQRALELADLLLEFTERACKVLVHSGQAYLRTPRRHLPAPRAQDAADEAPRSSTAIAAASVGVRPTRTPRSSRACAFAAAVPADPETIAPAWPICLPGGAVKPAM